MAPCTPTVLLTSEPLGGAVGTAVGVAIEVDVAVGVIVLVGAGVDTGVAVGAIVLVGAGVDAGVAVGVGLVVMVGVGVGTSVGIGVAVVVDAGLGVMVGPGVIYPIVTLPLVTLMDTGDVFTSLTITLDRLRNEVPDTLLAVKLIFTNVPGFETVQKAIVEPQIPVILPMLLLISI